MADRMTVEIAIGGPVPRSVVDDLIAAICSEGLLMCCDEGPFTAATAEELLELSHRDGRPGILHLLEHEVAWGRLEDLEEFLLEHSIAFDRWTEAKYEYDAELVSRFRRASGTCNLAHPPSKSAASTTASTSAARCLFDP